MDVRVPYAVTRTDENTKLNNGAHVLSGDVLANKPNAMLVTMYLIPSKMQQINTKTRKV